MPDDNITPPEGENTTPPPIEPPVAPPIAPPEAPTPDPTQTVATTETQGYPTLGGSPIPAAKKSTGKVITIVITSLVGIICLILVAFFAYKALSGESSGSSSPDGVIKNTLSALKSQDLLGAARQADPNEIEPFIENYSRFTDELESNGEVSDGKKPLEPYHIEVDGLETKTVMYSDDVARVELLDGEITIHTDKSKLPKDHRDGVKEKDVLDISEANDKWQEGDDFSYGLDEDNFDSDELESEHIFYIAVKRDGRWYASGLYTTAEYFRILGNAYGGDYERPTFDIDKRVGDGATSAEQATKNFIQSFVGLDSESFIDSTAPDRFSIAYDYKDILLKAEKRNADNEYYKVAKDAVKVTDIKTSKKKEGKNTEFVTIKSIDLKVKYSIDVKDKDKGNYAFVPYAADVDASWDGKCYSYDGTYSTYEESVQYFSTVAFPITDSSGKVSVRSDFDDEYPSTYSLDFPVIDASGRIYPTDYSLTHYGTYHPLPWYNNSDEIVFDINGNEVTPSGGYSSDKDYPYTDANGDEVIDEDGYDIYDDAKSTFASRRENIEDKNCLSERELKDLPDFGLVTIKEDGKFYVSPIDTIWHYVIWGIDNN